MQPGSFTGLLILAIVTLIAISTPPADRAWAGEFGGRHGDDSLALTLGNGVAYPEDEELRVPLYISSGEDVSSFQMSLEYEDVLLREPGVRRDRSCPKCGGPQ